MRYLALAAALLAASPALADGDAAFRTQVESLVKHYGDALNGGNADGVLALYAPDGVFLGPDGKALHGPAEIRNILAYVIGQGLHDELAVTEAHRFGNAGFAIGTFKDSKDSKALFGGTWNAAYLIDADKLRIKLLAVSVPPPAQPPAN